MSSNRPFLYNFLTAFRAHLPKPGTTQAPASVWASAAVATSQVSALSTMTSPRPIIDPRKSPHVATNSTNPPLARSTSPSPNPALQHTVSPLTHGQRGPSAATSDHQHHHLPHHRHHERRHAQPPGTQHVPPVLTSSSPMSPSATAQHHPAATVGGPTNTTSSYDRRRGSDSSSEGAFRDARGENKWYVGGRTAGGEERFYRLGLVRRDRSLDRLSADRLSL